MNNESQPKRSRENLTQELAKIRRSSLEASAGGDFRAVARLTMEAARINRELSAMLTKEESASTN